MPDICRHQQMRHTVWYWIENPYDPELIPYGLHFDDRKDALDWVSHQIVEPENSLRWIKIFRAHNEVYECYRWVNPEPYISPREDNKVLSVVNPIRWWQLRR